MKISSDLNNSIQELQCEVKKKKNFFILLATNQSNGCEKFRIGMALAKNEWEGRLHEFRDLFLLQHVFRQFCSQSCSFWIFLFHRVIYIYHQNSLHKFFFFFEKVITLLFFSGFPFSPFPFPEFILRI